MPSSHGEAVVHPRKRAWIDLANAGQQAALTVHPANESFHAPPGALTPCCSVVASPSSLAQLQQPAYLEGLLHAGFAGTFFQFNDASSLSHYFIATAVSKAHSAVWPRFVAGILAGLFVVIGTLFALVSAGGVSSELRSAQPFVPKLLTGATFPISLVLILLAGGDLFTGDCMYVGLAWFTGRLSLCQALGVLLVSFCSNICGCLLSSYILAYRTELLSAEPYHRWMLSVADTKVSLSWGVALLRGVGANTLVCLAIFLCSASRDALGRLVLGWISVMVFSVIGFEHTVANMASIPIAMMYGAPITVSQYIVRSLIPVTLGNIIGGTFLVGGFLTYLYCWEKREHTGWTQWLIFNFVRVGTWTECARGLQLHIFNNLPIGEERV